MHLLDLTKTEYILLEAVCDTGKTLKEIAYEQQKSLRTVEGICRAAKKRNQAKTLYQLIGWFASSRVAYEYEQRSIST